MYKCIPLLKVMRPHQWFKNLLLFVPLFVAHEFNIPQCSITFLALLVFSLGASAGYIINDILDRKSDRMHADKRHRPIASGSISVFIFCQFLILFFLKILCFLILFYYLVFILFE